MDLTSALDAELARRRAVNPRYSLRAFARALGISHSSLSRLLRGQRPSVRARAVLGPRVGWDRGRVERAAAGTRVEQLRVLAASPGFVADARWLASRTGLSLDDVQRALHDALRTGRITMTSTRRWTVEAR